MLEDSSHLVWMDHPGGAEEKRWWDESVPLRCPCAGVEEGRTPQVPLCRCGGGPYPSGAPGQVWRRAVPLWCPCAGVEEGRTPLVPLYRCGGGPYPSGAPVQVWRRAPALSSPYAPTWLNPPLTVWSASSLFILSPGNPLPILARPLDTVIH